MRDPEKHARSASSSSYETDFDTSENHDSHDPHDPFISPDVPPRQHPAVRRIASMYASRVPTRTMRCLCFLLASALVIFVLGLMRLSHLSNERVQSGDIGRPILPAPWESFPFLKRYYGGLKTLTSKDMNVPEYPPQEGRGGGRLTEFSSMSSNFASSSAYWPLPNYRDDKYRRTYGEVKECFLDEKEMIKLPRIHSYNGVPMGMPEPAYGSYEVLGIDGAKCFDRYGRLGPYGFGYTKGRGGIGAGLEGERVGADNVWKNSPEIAYSEIRWAEVQSRCFAKNRNRFNTTEATKENSFLGMETGSGKVKRAEDADVVSVSTSAASEDTATLAIDESTAQPAATSPPAMPMPQPTPPSMPAPDTSARPEDHKVKIPRTAMVIRTWWTYKYGGEDILYLRSIISELSLSTGGEFTVHFLVHVQDDNAPIWSDPDTYDRVLRESLPEEFRGMATLWSERQMGLIYGGLEETFYRELPVHGAFRSAHMPMQYFAHTHPEYEYFWNWEMDARYTGHWYELFSKVREWAKEQPRKGLWERNHRFYIPSVHGSWDDFQQMVRVRSQMPPPPPSKRYGPDGVTQQSEGAEKIIWGPEAPPDSFESDSDPKPPTTSQADNYEWGVGEEADLIVFNPLFDPHGTGWILNDDVTGYGNNAADGLPRRAAIITASRMSRRLLTAMHRETALGRHTMFSEMWPASCALHHGLKAVFAPHPVHVDREWPPKYLDSIYNAGKNGASGGNKFAVFGDDQQNNFLGTTWYYRTGFPENLWRRWLGFRVDGGGGEQEEIAGEGRMCLPPMLLHPVKGIELIVEGPGDE